MCIRDRVDAAGTEGRDPVADIKAINKELEAYNPQLLKKPQVIAANKIDAIAGDENEVISALRAEFEPQGIKVDVYKRQTQVTEHAFSIIS